MILKSFIFPLLGSLLLIVVNTTTFGQNIEVSKHIGDDGQDNKTSVKSGITKTSSEDTLFNAENSKKLDSLSIDFQFRGNCYAYSSEKNAIKSNGEAHSDNLPNMVDDSFPKGSFYLMIDEKNLSTIDDTFLGCLLYLVNTSGAWIKLTASDSRLNIVAEALNEKNEWTPISFLPQTWCGNSYHTVILDNNEYWSFDIPVFKGTFKTKLRYTLTFANDTKISSNEIVTSLNMGQFDNNKKEGYYSSNIMDPYGE